MTIQLYLHFPFCKSKCRYCDFCSAAPKNGEMAAYCGALIREIEREAPQYRDFSVDTVFLGGGTPSLIPAPLMDSVLTALNRNFSIEKNAEFSTEANPGTLNSRFLDAMASQGVNRVSLGMQAKQPRLLKLLGRIHDFDEVVSSVALIRSAGIGNINLDVMNSLPTQTAQDYLETLEAAAALRVQHISAYSLIVEENTPLCQSVEGGELVLPTQDEAADMDAAGSQYLEKRGYHRYEISNYAQNGFECRHNLGYWQGKYYLGLGVAAHSMLPPKGGGCYDRCYNTSSTADYIARLAQGQSPRDGRDAVMPDDAMFESMMLGLRTVKGVDASMFAARFGVTPEEKYSAALDSLYRDALAASQGGFIALTPRGLAVQNAALLRLMS